MKLTESTSEQSVMTPSCLVNSRLVHRSKEFNRTNMTFNDGQQMPTMCFDNYTLNGLPEMSHDKSSFSFNMANPLQMPEAIQKFIGAGRGFKMKVFERTYDISVNDSSKMSGVLPSTPRANSKQFAILPQPLELFQDPTQQEVQVLSSSSDITVVERTIKIEKDSDSDSDVVLMSEETVENLKTNEGQKAAKETLLKKQGCNTKSLASKKNKSRAKVSLKSTKTSSAESENPTRASKKSEKQCNKSNEKEINQKVLTKKSSQVKTRTNSTKRNAQNESTTETKTKKVRYRSSLPLSSSSSEENKTLTDLKVRLTFRANESSTVQRSDKSADITNETTEELFIQSPVLTLDNISCGSSCSTVSSDDDFFYPSHLEQKKQQKMFKHRQNKLMNRTGRDSTLNKDKPSSEKAKKESNVSDSYSTSESDDDFSLPQELKERKKKQQMFERRQNKLAGTDSMLEKLKPSSEKTKQQEQKENSVSDSSSPNESDDGFLMPQEIREIHKAKKARCLAKNQRRLQQNFKLKETKNKK